MTKGDLLIAASEQSACPAGADAPPLRLVVCCGLFRAASTWAFNVTAEIARSGGANPLTIFAEDVATVAA